MHAAVVLVALLLSMGNVSQVGLQSNSIVMASPRKIGIAQGVSSRLGNESASGASILHGCLWGKSVHIHGKMLGVQMACCAQGSLSSCLTVLKPHCSHGSEQPQHLMYALVDQPSMPPVRIGVEGTAQAL